METLVHSFSKVPMKLTVNMIHRNSIMRAHSATHLLHYGLEKLL